MTKNLDSLRVALEELSEPPGALGANNVWRNAATQAEREWRSPSRRSTLRRSAVGVLAAALVIGIAVFGVLLLAGPEPDTQIESVGNPRVSVQIAVGRAAAVDLTDDTAWVAVDEGDNAWSLSAFQRSNGELRGTATFVGAALRMPGQVLGVTHTNEAIWVRASVTGEPAPPVEGALADAGYLVRIDPVSLAQQGAVLPLGTDGPLVAHSDRVIAADSRQLVIVTDKGSTQTLEYATAAGTTPPGRNGLVTLVSSPSGIWALHSGNQLALHLDAESGALTARSLTSAGSAKTIGADTTWIGLADDGTAVGVEPTGELVRTQLPPGYQFLGGSGARIVARTGQRLVASTPAGEASIADLGPDEDVVGVQSGWIAVSSYSAGRAGIVSFIGLDG